MKKIFLTIFFLSLCSLCFAWDSPGIKMPTSGGNVFYVDNVAGSEANNGLTESTAFRSIQKAVSSITATGSFFIWIENTGTAYELTNSIQLASSASAGRSYFIGYDSVPNDEGRVSIKNAAGSTSIDGLIRIAYGGSESYFLNMDLTNSGAYPCIYSENNSGQYVYYNIVAQSVGPVIKHDSWDGTRLFYCSLTTSSDHDPLLSSRGGFCYKTIFKTTSTGGYHYGIVNSGPVYVSCVFVGGERGIAYESVTAIGCVFYNQEGVAVYGNDREVDYLFNNIIMAGPNSGTDLQGTYGSRYIIGGGNIFVNMQSGTRKFTTYGAGSLMAQNTISGSDVINNTASLASPANDNYATSTNLGMNAIGNFVDDKTISYEESGVAQSAASAASESGSVTFSS